tara:strand:+ start:192 stop:389 length:198 start_codon:yes stop_codon:yes gene_type:complete
LTIENTIIMERSRVGAGATIKNAIIDKDVTVPTGTTISLVEADRSRFKVTDGGIVVVPKGYVIQN